MRHRFISKSILEFVKTAAGMRLSGSSEGQEYAASISKTTGTALRGYYSTSAVGRGEFVILWADIKYANHYMKVKWLVFIAFCFISRLVSSFPVSSFLEKKSDFHCAMWHYSDLTSWTDQSLQILVIHLVFIHISYQVCIWKTVLENLSWENFLSFLSDMTLSTAVHLLKPCLNFLHHSMSKVVKLNTPRGGGPLFQHASAPPSVIL